MDYPKIAKIKQHYENVFNQKKSEFKKLLEDRKAGLAEKRNFEILQYKAMVDKQWKEWSEAN